VGAEVLLGGLDVLVVYGSGSRGQRRAESDVDIYSRPGR
jgi:predicted nucleotidyltransferase